MYDAITSAGRPVGHGADWDRSAGHDTRRAEEAWNRATADAGLDRGGTANARPAAGGAGASDAGKTPPRASDSPDGSTPVLAAAVPVSGNTPTPDKAWAADLAKDPSPLVGKSAEQVASEFKNHGFEATVEQSAKGSGRAELVRIERSPVSMVEVHPGEGSHGGAYTKVSTDGGKFKYVDPDTYVRRSPEPKTKFFDAKTGAPVEEASLPLRGGGGQSGATPLDPPASGPDSPGPAPSGGARAPPSGGAEGGGPSAARAAEPAAKPVGSGGAGQVASETAEQVAKDTGVVRGAEGALVETVGKAGKVLVPVAIAANAVQLGQAVQQDGGRIGDNTGRTASGIAASWGGAIAGAEGGAALGAAIGSVVPGAGTAVGAVVGGVIGAVAGGVGGDWVGRHGYDLVKSWF